jgi:hypothetical protein
VEVKKGLYVARAVIMCNGLPVCTYLRMGHRNVLPVVRFEMTRRKICPIFLKIVSRKWGSPIPYLEPREGLFTLDYSRSYGTLLDLLKIHFFTTDSLTHSLSLD